MVRDDEPNESDPTLDEQGIDRELNFELAQDFVGTVEHARIYSRYVAEKEALVGDTVELPNKRDKNYPVKWRVRQDIKAPPAATVEDIPPSNQESYGVKHFDFNRHSKNSKDGNKPRINTLELLLHLWPGDFRAQVDAMNRQIALDNCERIGKGRRKVHLVSYREMGVFLGIFLVARLEGKKGSQLWVGDPDKGEGYRSQIDMSSVMKEYRHRQLRNYFDIFFADHLKKGEDAWWKVMGGVEGFNQNRKEKVKSSHEKTPDESMSAHRPRTTATGKLMWFHLRFSTFFCISA